MAARHAMTAVEGASKLLSSEGKSQMKASSLAESTAGERDVFREIPLRYAGKCRSAVAHTSINYVANHKKYI